MKRLITVSIIAFFATFAKAQIHSSGGQVYLHDGDISSYTNPDIRVSPRYHYLTDSWTITCTVVDPSIDVQEVVEFIMPFTSSELDAYTGSGTETQSIIDVCEKAIIDYLKTITANSPITFSQ